MIGIYLIDGSCIKLENCTMEDITDILEKFPDARYIETKEAIIFIAHIVKIVKIK